MLKEIYYYYYYYYYSYVGEREPPTINCYVAWKRVKQKGVKTASYNLVTRPPQKRLNVHQQLNLYIFKLWHIYTIGITQQ